MNKPPKDKTERQKLLEDRRQLRKDALGGSESAQQRFYSELTKTRRALKVEAGLSKSKQSDTSIEIFVENYLKELGIEYKKQKRIRYLNYDFYIPSTDTLIEIQGTYHHVDPRVYAQPKNEMQRKNLLKNEIKRQFAKEANIKLVEIWQMDIEKTPASVKKVLRECCGINENPAD